MQDIFINLKNNNNNDYDEKLTVICTITIDD